MTTKTCDRCGAEIREFPWQAMMVPAYYVEKVEREKGYAVQVDLCLKCQADFAEWLKKKKKEADNDKV